MRPRVSSLLLAELAAGLSQRDRQITETVGRFGLVSGKQIERLFFAHVNAPSVRARLARRSLARLYEQRILGRTERRVGGVRAGAAGHVYYPASVGQRLITYWQGAGARRPRSRHEPSSFFARHTLAVTEVYVSLVEAARAGRLELLEFTVEPDCWRPYVDRAGARAVLKPDALVRLGIDRDFEERAFVEMDLGTEGRAALRRKCLAYLAYWRTGIEAERFGVFPRVVWITTTARRVEVLTDVCASLPPEAWKLFVVARTDQALGVLTGQRPRIGGAP